ncbi:hypothetical protein QBC44DRAFT_367607 [Cladorrhinum sp. PSN332]|nr:hypothetical protein QBC44DRAFT_367607 [Cladorrhinum sp. PSN332]
MVPPGKKATGRKRVGGGAAYKPSKRTKVDEEVPKKREYSNAWKKGKAQVPGEIDDTSSDEDFRRGLEAKEKMDKKALGEESEESESDVGGRPYSNAWKTGKAQVDGEFEDTESDEEARRNFKTWNERMEARQEEWKQIGDDLKTKVKENAKRAGVKKNTSRKVKKGRGPVRALKAVVLPPPRLHIDLPRIDWSIGPERPPQFLDGGGAINAKMIAVGPAAGLGPGNILISANNPREKKRLGGFLWGLGYDLRYMIYEYTFKHPNTLVMTPEMMGYGTKEGNEFYVANERDAGEYGAEALVIDAPKKRLRFGQDMAAQGALPPYTYNVHVRSLMRTAKWLYLEVAKFFYQINTFKIFVDFNKDLNDPIGRVSELFALGVRRLQIDVIMTHFDKQVLEPPLALLQTWMENMQANDYRVEVPWKIREILPPGEFSLPVGQDFPTANTPGWRPGWDEDMFGPADRLEREIQIHPHYPFIKTLSKVHWAPIIRRLEYFRPTLNVVCLEKENGNRKIVTWINRGTGRSDRQSLRGEKAFMKPINELFDFFRQHVRALADCNTKFALCYPDDTWWRNRCVYRLTWPGIPGAPRPPEPFACKLLDYFGNVLRRPGDASVDPGTALPSLPVTGRGSRAFRLD